MTKDDLIEALEKALMREGADWEDDAGACADAVVEFVAGWLTSKGARISDHNPEALSTADWLLDAWRKEMSG